MATENAGSLRWTLEADDSQLISSLDNASKAISDLSKALKQSEKDLSDTGKAAKDAGKEVDSIKNDPIKALSSAASDCAKSFLNLQNSIGDLSSSFANVRSAGANIFSDITTSANAAVNAVAGVSTAIGGLIADYANQGIQGADFIAQANAQLIGLTHSVEGANSALAQSVQYYKNNPFDRFSTISATKQLLTFGNAVEDVGPLLNKIGNVALANGVSIDEMARRYAETTSMSTVMVGQLDELAQVAPGIWSALGKQVGKSAGEVRDSLEGVGIDVETVKKAFDSLVDEDAMAAFEKTLARQTNRVKGRLSDVAAAIAGYTTDASYGFKALDDGLYMSVVNLEKSFADVLTSSTETGKRMQAVLGRIGKAIAPIIDRITENMPQIVNTVLDLLDKLAGVIEKVSNALTSSETDWKAFIPIVALLGSQLLGFVSTITGGGGAAGGLMGAIGQLGSGVKGLSVPMLAFGAVLVKQMATNEDFRNSVGKLMSSLGQLATRLFEVFTSVADSGALTNVLEALIKALTALADIINKLPTPVLEAFIYAIIAGSTINKIGGFTTSIIQMGAAMKDTAKDVVDFGNKIKDLASKGLNALNGISPSGGGKVAKKASSGVQDAIDAVNGQLDNLGGVSQQLTKGQNIMKTMRMGIENIIFIAGAIAAMGKALEIAYKSIPDDLAGLAAKLVVMGVVIGAVAVLGKAIDKVKVSQKSILKMIEMAGVIGSLGLALGLVNTVVPNDLGGLSAKLGVMAVVVGAVGALAVASDKFNVKQSSLLLMVEIAGVVATLGIALGLVNLAIPSDIGGLYAKLGVMASVVVAVGALGLAIDKAKVSKAALLEMVAIAGVVAALAMSLSYANSAIPNDIGGLYAKLGVMASVVGAIGVLAAVAGKVVTQVGTGLLAIVGVAGTIAVVAASIEYANKAVPADIGTFTMKLGVMAEAILGIGVLAAAIGALMDTGIGAIILGSGLAAMLAIAGAIAAIGASIGSIDKAIPDNFEPVKQKINLLVDVIQFVAKADIGGLISNIKAAINTALVTTMVNNYVTIARDLNRIQAIVLFKEEIFENLQIIKDAVTFVGDTGGSGIISSIMNVVTTFVNTVDIALVRQMVSSYTTIAIQLNLIQHIMLESDKIKAKLTILADIVDFVTDMEEGGIGAIFGVFSNFIKAINVESAKAVVGAYYDIATQLDTIENIELDYDTIKGKMDVLKSIVELVTDTGPGGMWDNLKRAWEALVAMAVTECAKNILGTYKDIVETLKELQKVPDEFDNGKVDSAINMLKGVVEKVTDLGPGGLWDTFKRGYEALTAEKVSEKAKSILQIYKDMIEPLKMIAEMDVNVDEMNKKVDSIGSVVSKVTGVREEDGGIVGWFKDIGTGGKIDPEKAKVVLENIKVFKDIASNINSMQGIAPANWEEKIPAIQHIVEAINNITTDSSKFSKIRDVVYASRDMVTAMGSLAIGINGMQGIAPENWTEKIPAIQHIVDAMSKIKSDSGKFENIKSVVSSVNGSLPSMRSLANEINGMQGIAPENWTEKIPAVKNVIDAMFKINSDVDKISSIQQVVSKIVDMAGNMSVAINKINALPGINDKDGNTFKNLKTVIDRAFEINPDAAKMSNIQNVVWRIIDLAGNTHVAINGINGLPGINDKEGNTFKNLKTVIDQAFKINPDAAKMSEIQNVVWRMIDLAGNAKVAIEKINALENISEESFVAVGNLVTVINHLYSISSKAEDIANIQNVVKTANIIIDDLISLANKLANVNIDSNYTAGLQALMNVLTNIINTYVLSITAQLPKINLLGQQIGDQLVRGIRTKFPDVILAGADTQGAYWNAIEPKLQDEYYQGVAMAQKFVDGLRSKLGEVTKAGADTQGAYWNAIEPKMQDEYYQGQTLAQNLINGIRDKYNDIKGAGSYMIEGFNNGANSINIYQIGQTIANRLIQGIKDRGEQGSPWKTTFESGAFAVQGMVEGMASEQRNLVNKAESLASAVQNAFDGTSASITPELNSTAQRTPTVYASTPEMFDNEQIGGNGRVVINQTNNNYTDYSIRKINRDLRWQLSTI